ncbi:LysR family transcriptional regulator [Oceanibacterium hippocampi]|uniref:HTH-type transcriptional regulator CynR n=1 Tax=Oceanibacterium hippocampi TaxID=745714 RepID=A0A1Y5SQT8_9PROT|nr:LysR family transcriptional regulator [Oceanibacterium hippocampi]SLN43209.1 HTH-type transcriptional regulator CynR [Oceanibacterium hippocampi]
MHAVVLRYFDEVARRGSIRKAAQSLNVASSAVNRQILKLEEELGTRLFERLADGVRLTRAGEILIRHTRNTLYEFERTRSDIEHMRDLKTGHVSIAALESLLLEFLPDAVSEFAIDHPGITFAVNEAPPEAIVEAVATGEVDVGISFLPDSLPLAHVVAEIPAPLKLIVSPQHPLATRRFVRLQECAGYPLALIYGSRIVTDSLREELAATTEPQMTRVETNALDMVKRVVAANVCLGFLTEIGVRRELEEGTLMAIPLVDSRLSELRMGIIVPSEKRLAFAARIFVEHLTSCMNRLST